MPPNTLEEFLKKVENTSTMKIPYKPENQNAQKGVAQAKNGKQLKFDDKLTYKVRSKYDKYTPLNILEEEY